jgi:anti-anti-sigma regulatory factor
MWDKLKGLFGGKAKGTSDDDSDDMATRMQERARKQQRRRDEFITKRELETLRKARQQRDAVHHAAISRSNPVNQAPINPGAGAPKEDTLRKINEIERMMSVDVKGTPSRPGPSSELNRAFAPTEPFNPQANKPVVIQAPSNPFAPTQTDEQRIAAAFQKTEVIEPRASPAPRPAAAGAAPDAPPAGDFFAPTEAASASGFLATQVSTASQSLAVEVQELSHDPVLEEASIHFANAEYAEAEAVLRQAVAPTGPGHRSSETWLALFDLYRAIGAQSKFESLGLDYVGLFETSAPNWYSLADAPNSAGAAPAAAGAAAAAQATYTCQPQVDAWAANQLNQYVETRLISNTPVALDFSRLQAIGHDGADVLLRCFGSLNRAAARVSLTKAGALADACEKLTVAGDKTVPQNLWLLRLEVLRLLGRNEEFENAALDYCVTYEVSPPAWQASKVSIAFADQAAPEPNWELQAMDEPTLKLAPISVQPGMGDATMSLDLRAFRAAAAELSGEITAGMNVISADLQKAAKSSPVTVNCRMLKRVDFASAGNLLNWVLELQGEGKQVQFIDTHRLIAAFFNVIGISGHAKVTLRKD